MPEVNAVEGLRRAALFWRTLAVVSWVVLALGAPGTVGLFAAQREQAVRAALAEAEARAVAEQALERAAEERAAAEDQLDKAKEETARLLYAHQIILAHRQWEQANRKNAPE